MKKIPSFTIDHLHLLRGIYVSRKDMIGGEVVTTFDIRMKEPNREPALGQGALHTIEHLAATFLRNHPVWGERIVYWGPMGCLTGNYLLVRGDWQAEDMVEKFLGLHQKTVEIICCMTCPWQNGNLRSICVKYCWLLNRKICIIRSKKPSEGSLDY